MRRAFALTLGLVALGSVAGAQPDAIKQWNVPWSATRPRDPFPDGKGHVWFVGQAGNYVAYLDVKTGEFKRYEIEAGTMPHNLTINGKGEVWITGNMNSRLVKLDPATGKLGTHMPPDANTQDPHTI